MKIESMDAHNISYPRPTDQGNVHKSEKVEIKNNSNSENTIRDERVESKNTDDNQNVPGYIYEGKDVAFLNEYEKKNLPVGEKVLIEAIEKANKAINGASKRFEFAIHEKTKKIMVKVINSETNEVIREIPPEKTLDLVAKMWEMAGLIVDEKR